MNKYIEDKNRKKYKKKIIVLKMLKITNKLLKKLIYQNLFIKQSNTFLTNKKIKN